MSKNLHDWVFLRLLPAFLLSTLNMEEETEQRGDDDKHGKGFETVVVREFESVDEAPVLRIFAAGMREMVVDTAFKGLRHHPESLLLYFAAALVFLPVVWWLIGIIPVVILCGRYFFSRRVIHSYLQDAMSTDMGDIEEFYMKPADSRLFVAVLGDEVVGVVAAVGRQGPRDSVELRRMSVDHSCRRRGVGMALGRKVLEFAATRGYSTVVLGTTAYTPAAHKLYQCLGFRCVGVTNGYVTPGTRLSLLERVFYRVKHYHYSLDLQNALQRDDNERTARRFESEESVVAVARSSFVCWFTANLLRPFSSNL